MTEKTPSIAALKRAFRTHGAVLKSVLREELSVDEVADLSELEPEFIESCLAFMRTHPAEANIMMSEQTRSQYQYTKSSARLPEMIDDGSRSMDSFEREYARAAGLADRDPTRGGFSAVGRRSVVAQEAAFITEKPHLILESSKDVQKERQKTAITQMFNEGASDKEMADKLKIGIQKLGNIRREMNLKRRPGK